MQDDVTTLSIYCELYRLYPTTLQLIIQSVWFVFLHSKSKENLDDVLRIVNQNLMTPRCKLTLLLILGRIAMKQNNLSMTDQQSRYCISYCNGNSFFWWWFGVLY
jgi:hypothetical protein